MVQTKCSSRIELRYSKDSFRRPHLLSSKTNIFYRLIILFPFYFINMSMGYIRMLMFLEYQDLKLVFEDFVRVSTFWMPVGVKRYTVRQLSTMLVVLSVYLVLMSHMLACVNIILEKSALGSTEVNNMNLYISQLYFLITTSTSVGYGDITINHQATRLVIIRYSYQVLLMLFSVMVNGIFYSLIFSSVFAAAQLVERGKYAVEQFDEWLGKYYRHFHITSNDQNKYYKIAISFFKFSYYFNIGRVVNMENLAEKLPITYSNFIKESVTLGIQSKFASFFSLLTPEAALELIMNLEPLM